MTKRRSTVSRKDPRHCVSITYWVLKVLLHPGPAKRPVKLSEMTPAATATTLALVAIGEYVCLPDGCIAEPVADFDNEVMAHEHRADLLNAWPESDFRVILATTDPLY